MKISICGDIHGSFKHLSILAQKEQPDIIIQCGDFGYWDKEANKELAEYKENVPVYFCRGNHENHDLLDENYAPETGDMKGIYPLKENPNIHLCNAGSFLNIEGNNILFIGGAHSVDFAHREEKVSWWSQELLSEDCKSTILSNYYPKINMIIAHTAPLSGTNALIKKGVQRHWTRGFYYTGKVDDCPMPQFLQKCLQKFEPSYFIHGHFHLALEQTLQRKSTNTKLISLTKAPEADIVFPMFYCNLEFTQGGISELECIALSDEEVHRLYYDF